MQLADRFGGQTQWLLGHKWLDWWEWRWTGVLESFPRVGEGGWPKPSLQRASVFRLLSGSAELSDEASGKAGHQVRMWASGRTTSGVTPCYI